MTETSKGADVVETLHWLAGLAPTRLTGTRAEREVQEAIAARLSPKGYVATWQPFRFPRHIYGSLALHFGLVLVFANLATWSPWIAAAGHLLVAVSFWSEAARRRHLLRKLWPAIDTQNLLMTRPATGTLRRRIVLLAHVDSAFTGLMFTPALIKVVAAPPPRFLPFLRKQLALPLAATLGFVGVEVASGIDPTFGIPIWARALLAVPPLVVFVLNIDIVIRNEVVPGAADNLSGCAAQIVLAEGWDPSAHPDVELVFAFTGAEEAGTGGAAHLARSMKGKWDPAITDVFVLDTLSNGNLHILEEGELYRRAIPERLAALVRGAAGDAGLPAPIPYIIPAGATDALVFLVEGYEALALTCVDPVQHAPLNYHHPNDTADRVEPEQLRASTRLAARLIARAAAA